MAIKSIFPEDNQGILDRPVQSVPGDVGPAVSLFYEKQREVASFRELYNAGDVGIYPSRSTRIEDIPKFLFGPQMTSYGVVRDWDTFQDVASNVWEKFQEDPIWTMVDAAALGIAVGAPLFRSYKMGAIGKALNKGFKFYPNSNTVDKLPNLLTADKFHHWFRIAKSPEEEAAVLTELGYLPQGAKITNKTLDEVRSMVYHDSRMTYLRTKGMQWDEYQSRLSLESMKIADIMKLPHTDTQVVTAALERLKDAGITKPDISIVERAMYSFNKNFGQQMGSLQQDPSPVGQMRSMLHKRLDEMTHDSLMLKNALPQIETLNDVNFGRKLYTHAAAQMAPDALGGRRLPKLTPLEQRISDTWFKAAEQAQNKAKDLGLISETTPFVHLIGLTERGILQGEVPPLVYANSLAEALYSPTLLRRSSSDLTKQVSTILDRIDNGDLQATASVRNLVNGYLNDQMLMFNFEVMRDLLTEVDSVGMFTKRYAIPAAEILKGNNKLKHVPGYVALDKFFAQEKFKAGGEAMFRVLSKHLDRLGVNPDQFFGPNGELPYVNEYVMRHIFGKGGMWEQGQNAQTGLLAFVTSIHKFSKAVMNPGSHLQNELGNFAHASMAGFNMLDSDNVKLMDQMTDVFNDIHSAQVKALETFKTNTPTKTQVISFVANELKKTNRKVMYKGKEIPIDIYADDMVQNLYTEGAFDSHEAFGHLKRVYEENGMTDAAKAVARPVFNIFDSPGFQKSGLGKVFNKAQKNYLAADIVPKLAMFTGYLNDGMSVETAVRMVARRMPMYGVVGRFIAGGRSVALPWVTFPAEAIRIFKNNIMDNPLRVLPWLVAPGIAQSLFSAMGLAPGTSEEVEFAKRQLPFWAQTPGVTVTEGQNATAVAAGVQGGLFGALAGGRVGGLPGMAIGTAAGAAVPLVMQAINNQFTDQEKANKELRGAVLNWLPFTSFLPKTRSPDYEVTNIADFWGQLPAEPFAVVRALLEPVFGQTEFGEIKAPTLGSKTAKSFTNLIGFISPPWVQKYGFHTPTPDIGIMDLMVGPGARSLTTGGVGAAVGAGAGAFFGGAPGAAVGGAAGALLGASPNTTNLRRLLVDTGGYNDSVTGRPGSPVFDFILNTSGLWKSYEARGEVLEANRMRIQTQAFGELRSYYAKQISMYAENDDRDALSHSIQAVFDSYNAEFMGDPAIANEKFGEWLRRQASSLGRHPALRGMSDEELESKINKSIKFSSQMRGSSFDAWRSALAKERQVRSLQAWQNYWAEMKDKYEQ